MLISERNLTLNDLDDYARSIKVMDELGILTPDIKAEVEERIEKLKRINAYAYRLGDILHDKDRTWRAGVGRLIMDTIMQDGWTPPEGLF